MRRYLPFAFAALFHLGCLQLPPDEAAPANILLVSIDALRADHVGCYGASRPTTPFLDQLAVGGVRFEHAFVNTHGTTPSHTTMLSGLYQETHRVGHGWEPGEPQRDRIPDEVFLLPELLRAAGYFTIGVTDGGNAGRSFGFGRGFARFNDSGGGVAKVTDRALAYLGHVPDAAPPVFLFVHTYEVHSPYDPPPRYRGRFGPHDSELVATSENLITHAHTASTSLTAADLAHLEALYDEGLRFTDDVLRSFFEQLSATGFLDNALVVVTADHGEEFGEHGGVLHRGLLYDELLRVPLLVSGPGIPVDQVVGGLVSHVDLVPSILAWTGFRPPSHLPGRTIFGTGTVSSGRAVFAQYGDRRYGVRTARWKLIESRAPDRIELYDLEADPAERYDVASAHPEETERLLAAVSVWRQSAAPAAAPTTAEVVLDAEEIERLRALGYLGN